MQPRDGSSRAGGRLPRRRDITINRPLRTQHPGIRYGQFLFVLCQSSGPLNSMLPEWVARIDVEVQKCVYREL